MSELGLQTLSLIAAPGRWASRPSPLTTIEWPASLQFNVSNLAAVWYPMLPGVLLHRQWFQDPLNRK